MFGNTAQALFGRAVILIKGKHYTEAASLLHSAVKLAPDQANFHHYLGYALWKLDHWRQAQAEFEKAHKLEPKDPYTCYFLARYGGTRKNCWRALCAENIPDDLYQALSGRAREHR
ncbi:MAG TPA: tetratricopeptide repeat protein [Terriglobia bacterium]|nr:tetratricopeptide repeat protein [Terriglobia bacterium]